MNIITLIPSEVSYDHVKEIYKIEFYNSEQNTYCGEIFADRNALMDYFNVDKNRHELTANEMSQWKNHVVPEIQKLVNSERSISFPFSIRDNKIMISVQS